MAAWRKIRREPRRRGRRGGRPSRGRLGRGPTVGDRATRGGAADFRRLWATALGRPGREGPGSAGAALGRLGPKEREGSRWPRERERTVLGRKRPKTKKKVLKLFFY